MNTAYAKNNGRCSLSVQAQTEDAVLQNQAKDDNYLKQFGEYKAIMQDVKLTFQSIFRMKKALLSAISKPHLS